MEAVRVRGVSVESAGCARTVRTRPTTSTPVGAACTRSASDSGSQQ